MMIALREYNNLSTKTGQLQVHFSSQQYVIKAVKSILNLFEEKFHEY